MPIQIRSVAKFSSVIPKVQSVVARVSSKRRTMFPRTEDPCVLEQQKPRRISPVLIFDEFQTRPFTEGRRCMRGGVLKIHPLSQSATCLSSREGGMVRMWPERQPVSQVCHHNVLNRRGLFLSVARFARCCGFSDGPAAVARFFAAIGEFRKSPPRFVANALVFRRFS